MRKNVETQLRLCMTASRDLSPHPESPTHPKHLLSLMTPVESSGHQSSTFHSGIICSGSIRCRHWPK